MWYTGVGADWTAAIGLATSTDGLRWSKDPRNPVLGPGPPGSWEDYWVAVPSVCGYRAGQWMVYAGVSAADLADGRLDSPALGLAWSLDGVGWIRTAFNPFLTAGDLPSGAPWAPGFVISDTGRLLLWFETSRGIELATASGPSRLRRIARPPADRSAVER